MERPRRAAAQKALELIRRGMGIKEIDEVGSQGLTEEEEEDLDDSISGEIAHDLYDFEDSDEELGGQANVTGGVKDRFKTYCHEDTMPSGVKFRPKRPPGPHLVDRITRQGISNFTRAIDFFNLFMDDEIIQMIVDNTNFYGWVHVLDKPSYGKYSDGSWEETTPQELRNLIALILFLGYNGRVDLERNWCQAVLHSGGWARRFLSKNRFKALNGMLHITKPGTDDPNDKLTKVRPLLEHIREVSSKYYQPPQELSIDERMVRSKGRSPIRQYMPDKPTRFGYKLWCACEAHTGYTCDFSVYVGKDGPRSDKGLGYDVVMSLAQQFTQQGYRIYCDNYFTSKPLAEDLWALGTAMCGTTQPWRRTFPDILKGKEWGKRSKQGDMRYIREGQVLFLQWRDKKVVNMITTAHCGHESTPVSRHGKDKDGNYKPSTVQKPICVDDYNHNMGGVDTADQMIQTYNCLIKSRRWWKTLFFHMVDVATLNAYILFKLWKAANPNVPGLQRRAAYSHIDFREELTCQLARISEDEDVPLYTPALRKNKSLDLTGPHDPAFTDVRRNCVVCYIRHAKQVKSHIKCADPQCNVHLCLNRQRNCFPHWHSPEFNAYRSSSIDPQKSSKLAGQPIRS